MAPFRFSLTPLRRWIGAAVVVVLLIGAMVYYRALVNAPLAASSPSASRSPVTESGPAPTTPSPTPSRANEPSPARLGTIQVYGDQVTSAKPFETVRIHGTYHGRPDTFLQAEYREGSAWVAFPQAAKTDRLGRFITHVEFGEPGPHWVRVVDPAAKVASQPFVLEIKG